MDPVNEKSSGSSTSKYAVISAEKRAMLIKLTEIDDMTVVKASKLLEINQYTAKSIIRKFKLTGNISKSKRNIFHSCSLITLREETETIEFDVLRQRCFNAIFVLVWLHG
jgi:hypothetical protein